MKTLLALLLFTGLANAAPAEYSLTAPLYQPYAGAEADTELARLTRIALSGPWGSYAELNISEYTQTEAWIVGRGMRLIDLTGVRGARLQPKMFWAWRKNESATDFNFIYSQVFAVPGTQITPGTKLLHLRLKGTAFIECNEVCQIKSVDVGPTTLEWNVLPWDKGGNSSAGGIVQPD